MKTLRMLTLIGVVLGGCARSYARPADDPDGPLDGYGDAGHPIAGDSSAGSASMPGSSEDASVIDELPSSGVVEIWVGQLNSSRPPLCYPKGSAPSAPSNDTYHLERVVLILEQRAGGLLRGKISFGQGQPPESPDEDVCDGESHGSFWACSLEMPSQGAEYTLVEPIVRSGDRLMFEFVTGEIWNSWCEGMTSVCTQDSYTCDCASSPCKSGSYSRFPIELAIVGDTMEGLISNFYPQTFAEEDLGTLRHNPAQLRLRRVQ